MRTKPNDPLAQHMQRDRYGAFQLTGAIRPAVNVPVTPQQGYRVQEFRDSASDTRMPMLAAAVSRERLFELFLDLLGPLGLVVDAILETSHESEDGRHQDLIRESIDLPVLMSHLCDHEEMLLDDGCTGIAVLSEDKSMEVQFDEHKLLVIYAHDLEPFERILHEHGIRRKERLQLLTEGEHLHCTHPRFADEFATLANHLGVREALERVNG